MKIYRCAYGKRRFYARLDGDILHPVSGSIFGDFLISREQVPLADVRLLAPCRPSKIVAVGLNYRDHAEERGKALPEEPLLFLKPSSAVIGPYEAIVYPPQSKRVDYEGELAVVIGKKASRLSEDDHPDDYILGYTCLNDVTARDLQDRDVQFTRAKSFDTFAAVGPCLETDLNPAGVRIKTFLNGKLRQSGHTRNLIFSVPFLVRYISGVMTLYPGDVITTGTPSGVGSMTEGDRVDMQIEGIGTLPNTVTLPA